MKTTDRVSGPWCQDLAIEVIRERWPDLVHGRDYVVGHPVNTDRVQIGPPDFLYWRVRGMRKPTMRELKAIFTADETHYRAALARRYRNLMLLASDAKAVSPADLPPTAQGRWSGWTAYRQALREVPEQTGFPLEIDWPEPPDAS
jgi:hypothetical protein